MTPLELYQQTVGRGFRLQTDGHDLLIFGERSDELPPELVAELRHHKMEILALLKRQRVNLSLDRKRLLHVSRQILAGEFDDADRPLIENLTVGLRNIPHPLCRRALERLVGIGTEHESEQ